ncbi:MAG: hypothetical protein LJE68_09760 [Rhodobacter sp.]|nr:hypothetical protein [Rhodobacter sp.]
MLAVWILPLLGLGTLARIMVSVVLLALAAGMLVLRRQGRGGLELHVDTLRRELRAATLSASGERLTRSSVLFAVVAAPILKRSKADGNLRSLCLRITGESEVMTVAVGDETTLLAIHDRLMRDLQPIDGKAAGRKAKSGKSSSDGSKVFPKLGPDEVAA